MSIWLCGWLVCPFRTTPDVLADVPMDAFGLFDFTRADEIIAYGRQAMEKALREKDSL